MCGFILTNKFYHEALNFYCQKRGPDATNYLQHEGIHFVHNLLDISGKQRKQPLIEEDIFCLYNGEFYNSPTPYDGDLLLPHYDFSTLDGEFAVTLIDFPKQRLVISTDIFGTKPLWYAIEPPFFGVSSYKSPLLGLEFVSPKKLPANTTLSFSLQTLELLSKKTVHQFDLKQDKTHFEDWTNAFEQALIKRCQSAPKRFIGLSSGYDSGAIACGLNKLNLPFQAYTILGKETEEIVRARKERHKSTLLSPKIPSVIETLNESCETYEYKIRLLDGKDYTRPLSKIKEPLDSPPSVKRLESKINASISLAKELMKS